jgi:ABC-type Zn uptake system ZnuABC Zn-binding protein ZnuA
VVIRSEQELEVTRQRIKAFQDALIALRRNQSSRNYTQIAKNFLYEIKKMEEEVHEYLQCLPEADHTVVA